MKRKLDGYLLEDSNINVKILWAQCAIGHFLFHSYAQMDSLISTMFKDSQIADEMKFGKKKSNCCIGYGLAPYIKYISSSLVYVVSLDENMNSVIQNEQMDVTIRF